MSHFNASSFSRFKYRARDCNTTKSIQEALAHFETIQNNIPPHQLNNFNSAYLEMKTKLGRVDGSTKVLIHENLTKEFDQRDRIIFYHKSVELSVEFLKETQEGEKLDRLFYCLKGALRLTGKPWDTELMYTDNVCFNNAFTVGEKKIYFIQKILESGLHERRSIIGIINYFIKLINTLQLRDLLSVDLPNKKILHDKSFEPFNLQL